MFSPIDLTSGILGGGILSVFRSSAHETKSEIIEQFSPRELLTWLKAPRNHRDHLIAEYDATEPRSYPADRIGRAGTVLANFVYDEIRRQRAIWKPAEKFLKKVFDRDPQTPGPLSFDMAKDKSNASEKELYQALCQYLATHRSLIMRYSLLLMLTEMQPIARDYFDFTRMLEQVWPVVQTSPDTFYIYPRWSSKTFLQEKKFRQTFTRQFFYHLGFYPHATSPPATNTFLFRECKQMARNYALNIQGVAEDPLLERALEHIWARRGNISQSLYECSRATVLFSKYHDEEAARLKGFLKSNDADLRPLIAEDPLDWLNPVILAWETPEDYFIVFNAESDGPRQWNMFHRWVTSTDRSVESIFGDMKGFLRRVYWEGWRTTSAQAWAVSSSTAEDLTLELTTRRIHQLEALYQEAFQRLHILHRTNPAPTVSMFHQYPHVKWRNELARWYIIEGLLGTDDQFAFSVIKFNNLQNGHQKLYGTTPETIDGVDRLHEFIYGPQTLRLRKIPSLRWVLDLQKDPVWSVEAHPNESWTAHLQRIYSAFLAKKKQIAGPQSV